MKRLSRRGMQHGGYTIIETMIVFAASSALVVAVIAIISGQQGKTQFNQAVRDADSRMQDAINDFATGFYNVGNVQCSVSGTGTAPTLVAGTNQEGKNVGCAYIGRIFQMSIDSDTYYVHTLVGRQYIGTSPFSGEVTDLASAKPVLIHPTSTDGSIPNLSQTAQFNSGMQLASAQYLDASSVAQTAGPFGMVSNFGSYQSGQLTTDKQTPQLFILTSNYATDTALADGIGSAISGGTYVLNRPLALCFRSGSSNQYAVIRFGTNTDSTSSTVTIGDGTTCPANLFS